MPFALSSGSLCSIVGDSITSGFFSTADAIWKHNFLTAIKARYSPPPSARAYSPTSGTLPAPPAFPKFPAPNGISGRKTGDVSPNIMAVSTAGSTHAIAILGINDAAAINGATLTLGTLDTQVRKCLDDWRTGGVNSVLWVGPFGSGEKWPSGAGSGNPYDVHVDSVDAQSAGILAEYNATHGTYEYCSWRDLFDAQQPILNPGNLAQGVFTTDGIHPSATLPSTMALLVNAIVAKIGTVP